jgi:hypothetical protein
MNRPIQLRVRAILKNLKTLKPKRPASFSRLQRLSSATPT